MNNNFNDAKLFFEKGLEELRQKNFIKAKEFFDSSLKIVPNRISSMNNLGIALIELKYLSDAGNLADKIIDLFPNNEEGYLLKGKIYLEEKKFDQALKFFKKSIDINPNCIESYNFTAFILKKMKKTSDSIEYYYKSLNINQNQNFIFGNYLHLKMQLSDWNHFSNSISDLKVKIEINPNIISPFSLLQLLDDPNLHFKTSKAYNNFIYPNQKKIKRNKRYSKNKKIRIGYYSADFYNHAISYLIIGMLEKHNKEQFEIFLFSFNPASEDLIFKRIINTNHKFINVSIMSDEEIVQLSKYLEIDIAIDLMGYTLDSRPKIFEMVCAPIQIAYLGYPGTTGSNNIDYIIADKIVIPEKNIKYFSEKVIYLPNSYQVTDCSRNNSFLNLTKQELELPENDFIFCCFNNHNKITPDIFDYWMYVLKNVNNSILWLLGDKNQLSCKNLMREAEKRNIDSKRLIFAPIKNNEYHLSRYVYADLFLDTFPYNAHTTASDALWAGVPIVTLIGNSFASRVAASLLHSVGLSELITYSVEEYKKKIIEISTDRQKLNVIKNKLKFNKFTTPLFDTAKFTKDIEISYKAVFDRYMRGLEPDHFEVQ